MEMDWTPAYMVAATASFNASLQLHGYAGGHLLLDQTSPHVQARYDYNVDGTAPAAAAPRSASQLLAENQFSSSSTASRSCGNNVPASAMMMKPFPQQQPIHSQALEPERLIKSDHGGVREACSSVSRRSSVPDSPAAAKKPRMETPSSLPTFKVRKEKLVDRITALQQLVSPFGKMDIASVLHEAIECIKFLHDQVASLSSPYLRCGRPVQPQKQQGSSKVKKNGEAKKDLRSRGLCLVPVASTYAVANETAPEFWHPTFGGHVSVEIHGGTHES